MTEREYVLVSALQGVMCALNDLGTIVLSGEDVDIQPDIVSAAKSLRQAEKELRRRIKVR